MYLYRILILSISCLLIFSCNKSNEEPEYDYGPFNYGTISAIQSNGSTIVELQQADSNKVIRVSKGGPQISGIGGSLILNGGGAITIGVKDPLSIQLNGGGLKNKGEVRMKQLSYYGQSAKIVLDSITIDSTLTIQLMNTGDCSISGKASYLVISTYNFPTFFGFNLITDSCYVYHSGLSEVQVNVTKKLSGACMSMGNTFYKGNPDTVITNNIGSGKFIPY